MSGLTEEDGYRTRLVNIPTFGFSDKRARDECGILVLQQEKTGKAKCDLCQEEEEQEKDEGIACFF